MTPEPPFKSHFLLGHTIPFASNTLEFVDRCVQAGHEVTRAKIAFRDFYLVFEPEYIQHVTQKNYKNYRKSFAYEGLKTFLGNGLLTAEGKQWLHNRRALQPAFHRKALASLRQTMENTTVSWIQDLKEENRWEISIQKEMLQLTREILVKCLFGQHAKDIPYLDELDEILFTLREYANNKMKKPLMMPLYVPTRGNLQFKSAVRKMEAIVHELLNRHRNADDRPAPLLEMLLAHLGVENGSDQQIYDEVVTLFIAGQETTTNALSFLFYLIDRHPEEKDRLRNKTEERIELVVNEALRLYPPAWAISREAMEEDQLGMHQIPKGATLFLSIYAIQRHPDLWEAPNEFRPDRFKGEYPKKAYMPFGLGPRMCIGNHFALMEMEVIVRQVMNAMELQGRNTGSIDLVTPMTLNSRNDFIFEVDYL